TSRSPGTGDADDTRAARPHATPGEHAQVPQSHLTVQTVGMVPAFSVVVPTHGRPAFLDAAIRSVLAQTFTDFERIVVDDARPEAPVRPDDERLRLIVRSDNGGPAAARNTGIDNAAGTYLAFLDDDDIWLPDRLLAAHEAHSRAPVAVCWQSTLGAP